MSIPARWQPLGPNNVNARILSLAADASDPSKLYLAAPGGGIWGSTDAGQTWLPQTDSASVLKFCSVAADPVTSGIAYAGTGDDSRPQPQQGVAVTTDAGLTWTVGVRFTDAPICALAVDPLATNRIFAGSAEGLFVSNDSAATWVKVFSSPVTSISADGLGNVYAGVVATAADISRSTELQRSSDGGKNWGPVQLPSVMGVVLPSSWVTVLARGNNLYVAVGYLLASNSTSLTIDFCISKDGGTSWILKPVVTNSTNNRVSLGIDADGAHVYVAAKKIFDYRVLIDTIYPMASAAQDYSALQVSGASLLAGGEQGVESIAVASGGYAGFGQTGSLGQYFTVAFDSSSVRAPLAAGTAGLYRLVSGNWNPLISSGGIARVAPGPNNTSTLYAVDKTLVWSSTNLGVTWTTRTVLPASQLRAPLPQLVADQLDSLTAFVAGRSLYRTSDGNTTWVGLTTMDPDTNRVLTALTASPNARQIMYAATACLPELKRPTPCQNNSNIYRSTASGSGWSRMSTVMGIVNTIAIDPAQAGFILVGTGNLATTADGRTVYSGGDLLRSLDSGATWTSILSNLPDVPVYSIVVASSGSLTTPAQNLYVATDLGIFATFTGGTYWIPLNSGLPSVPIRTLAYRSPTLLAGSDGRGLFQVNMSSIGRSLVPSPMWNELTLFPDSSTQVGIGLRNTATTSLLWEAKPMESWLAADQSGGLLSANGTIRIALTVSSAGMQPGTYIGRFRLAVPPTIIGGDIWVALKVIRPAAQMRVISGNAATGVTGGTMPPLVVELTDDSGSPIRNLPVAFSITSGGGALSSHEVLTDVNGRAGVALTLPIQPATVLVTATSGSLSATFTVWAMKAVAPALMSNSVANAASYSPAALAAGTIVSVFGTTLSTATANAGSFPLPATLGGSQVLLADANGVEQPLPLFYVSPLQVNALLPPDIAAGKYMLSVQNGMARGNAVSLIVGSYAPAIFTLNGSGKGPGIFLDSKYALILAAKPAKAGDVVMFFATGLGAVNPPVAGGDPGAAQEPLNRTAAACTVHIDVKTAEVLYCGLAPGFAGLYQVNMKIPVGIQPATNVPVSLTIGNISSPSVTIPIQ